MMLVHTLFLWKDSFQQRRCQKVSENGEGPRFGCVGHDRRY